MKLENYLSTLETEIGEILDTKELMPGTYYVETDQGTRFTHEYYAVLDTALIAPKVQNYGEKIGGLRLFAWGDPSSGHHVVHYEVSKYRIAAQVSSLTEGEFRDMAFNAMELHPEYFGMFPVPFHTPHGCTFLNRTLANGIYWLETSECKELLAICPPIWEAELSLTAKLLGESMECDKDFSPKGYLFFSKEASCIPIYELMETRRDWDGTVINRPALMNAIWAFRPTYAMRLNGRKKSVPELEDKFADILEAEGLEAMPEPNKKEVVGMYPDAGTDFLLLK